MNAAVLTEHKRAARCSCLSLHTKEEGYPQVREKKLHVEDADSWRYHDSSTLTHKEGSKCRI